MIAETKHLSFIKYHSLESETDNVPFENRRSQPNVANVISFLELYLSVVILNTDNYLFGRLYKQICPHSWYMQQLGKKPTHHGTMREFIAKLHVYVIFFHLFTKNNLQSKLNTVYLLVV